MRVSARTREKAANLCSMAACSLIHRMYSIADNQQTSRAARNLAFGALMHVHTQVRFASGTNRYAEAESLIRTGWTP